MNKVIISEEAFVMMVAGAAEVYDKETYGLLLGRRRKKDYYIQYAVPHQSTRRYTYGVAITKKHEKKLIGTINFFKGYRFMGEFHSHPDSYCKLSKHDIKDMRESGTGISIIVAIEPADKYIEWKYDKRDKKLSGTIDDSFFVEIKAYKCHDDGGKRVPKLKLECDFVKKLNKRVRVHYPVFFENLPKRRRRRKPRARKKLKHQCRPKLRRKPGVRWKTTLRRKPATRNKAKMRRKRQAKRLS